MNILYICDEYPPGRHGGIGTSVQVLARQVAKMGHTVVVAGFCDWGYGGDDHYVDNGVQVYRFRRGLDSKWFSKKDKLAVRGTYKLFNMMGILQWDIARSLKKYRAFVESLIEKHSIEIIETPDFNEYVQYCKRYTPFPRFSRPTVIKLNGSLTYFLREEGKSVPEHFEKIDEQTLRQSDAVVSVSKYTAVKTAEYLHYDKQISVIHNGIEIINVTTSEAKQEKRVIFTGSLVRKKGIFQLMKAWNIVHKRLPEAELWVFGKGPVAKIAEDLSSAAASTVLFKGHVSRPELINHLATATLAIFPSYAEAFALAPLEAMACGTTVLNSNRTSGPELIRDGENGLLVDPDRVEEMAEKIVYIINNPDVSAELAAAGSKTVRAQVAINIIAEQNLAFYEKMLRKR